MMQQRYWLLMRQTKMSIHYFLLHIRYAEKWEKRFLAFLALTTSTSIGGWVIWNQIPLVWASIIASSHVLTSLKPYFPFASRLKVLPRFIVQLEDILLELERDWPDVAQGRLTEQKIHDKTMNIKSKLTKAERDCLGDVIIPPNALFEASADENANRYFRDNYPIGEPK